MFFMIEQELIIQEDALEQAFKTPGKSGVVRLTHPDTGIKVVARKGEVDLKNTRLIPVFDAGKRRTE